MATDYEITVSVRLVNSEINKVSELRRRIGVLALWLARRLLKSELRLETIGEPCKPPPLRYWQHGETGRVCASVLGLSGRWHEISRENYEQFDVIARDITTNA